jgi:hypothetical protein
MAVARNPRRAHRALASIALALAALGLTVAVPSAGAVMRSKVIARHLCKTVHGGRFVTIREFPGERIDRRLLPDLRWMERRFDVFLTDGYSRDPVHASNGEHPIGLATDLVPNRATGGTWGEIGELARLAEPKQDQPRPPWRWVGYNGDAGHGRGDHLHLSWLHSPTEPGNPARVVYTRKCPTAPQGTTTQGSGATGGTSTSGGSGSGSTGGITVGKLATGLAPAVPDN